MQNFDEIKNIILKAINQINLTNSDILDELESDEPDINIIANKIDTRDQVLNVLMDLNIESIRDQSTLDEIQEFIDFSQKTDKIIQEKLTNLKVKLKLEIAKTYKTKQNLKGYNLNNLK